LRMIETAIHQIAGWQRAGLDRGHFPLRLGWQALAAPAREGVRLVKADVAGRLGRIDGAAPTEREHAPATGALIAPIERRGPPLLLHQSPAIGQPELGAAIAAIGDESEVFARRGETGREPERLEPHLVARPLIVESEAVAAMADLAQAAGEG